jgi:hypothetical protein
MNSASKTKKLEVIRDVGDMLLSLWLCDGGRVKIAGRAMIQIMPHYPWLRFGQKCPILP